MECPLANCLLCTTKCYSVLQSITPVLLRTTPVLQNITPVRLCTTKYYSGTTKHFSSATLYYKVLLRTTKNYSSNTLYYQVLLRTTKCNSVTTKHFSSTTLYYSSTTPYYTSSSTSSSSSSSSTTTSTSTSTSSTNTKSQCYYSFARSTRTILRNGSTRHRKILILLQFRAIDTHDLTKGLHPAPENLNFTTVSCDRHARSYERVAPSTARSQFYYSFARSTRTILRKGCTQHRKIAVLLQFRAIDDSRCKIVKLLEFRTIDAYDLTKGLRQQVQNRQITTVSRDRHVGSYEKVTR